MTNKVGIGIEAQFDAKDVERQINALGQKIAQANKVQFTPFSKTTQSDVEKIIKQFEQLRKIHGELNRRMSATGQGNSTLFNLDWDKLYVDPGTRARQMRKVFEYATGAAFQSQPGQSPGAGGGGSGLGGMAVQVAQSGMRAAGPVGGVAANALGTGMSAGFGAGLMGLVGGLAALGVGKLVGSAVESIGQNEDNKIALDRLKRTIGDVNVSFNALEKAVRGSASQIHVTYAEAGQLAQQFVKAGNIGSGQYKTIADELSVAGGMSRAFGMDPSAGVGVMGQMRGLGITTNTQESRRFALLIGETIGKAGAFAKADEVLDAIAGFAASQTRNNMGAANVSGYAGLLAGMVGSGIPGMDVQGAAGLLARVNSSLSAGGAKGEASQFFTALVGNRLGLDPIQTQILREGGAFASNSSMFGDKSAYRRYMGASGPAGDKTYLQSSLEELRRQYGGDKGLLAQATANHLGIGINQAMAMLMMEPKQVDELSKKFGNLKDFNAAGIGNLFKAQFGTADDRMALATDLWKRSGRDKLTDDEQKRLDKVMRTGSAEEQKNVLSELLATRDQEDTQGKEIRDTRVAVQNIKTELSDKLLPVAQEMRDGIMWLAGGKDGKSGRTIREDMAKADIQDKYQRLIDKEWQKKKDAQDPKFFGGTVGSAYAKKVEESNKIIAGAFDKIYELKQQRDKEIEDSIKKLREDPEAKPAETSSGANPEGWRAPGDAPAAGSAPGNQSISRRRSRAGALKNDPSLRADVTAAEREIGAPPGLLWAQMEQESNFDPNAVSPAGAMGLAQVMPGTLANLERKLGRKLNPHDPKDAVLIQKEVMRENYVKFGNWNDALRAYNGGWNKSRWANRETSSYVPSIYERWVRNGRGTPLPEQSASSAGGSNSWSGMPLTGEMSLNLDLSPDARRLLSAPSVPVFTRFGPAAPFGTNVASR